MDMKKILQVIDGAGKRPVVDSSDMKRFVSIVAENNTQKDVAEGIRVVDQDYDLDQVILTLDIEGRRAEFTYTDYDENFENAERRDIFDQLQEKSWYKGLDHPTKMEILDAAYKAIRGEEPSEYKPRVDDEPLDIDEKAEEDPSEEEMDRTVSDLHKDVFGIRPSREWGREWMSMSEQEKRDLYYQMVDMLDQKQDMSEGLSFKDYLNLAEAKKKITASEDPCWKGYKMVGTKKKGGREVPNCVPGKKGD